MTEFNAKTEAQIVSRLADQAMKAPEKTDQQELAIGRLREEVQKLTDKQVTLVSDQITATCDQHMSQYVALSQAVIKNGPDAKNASAQLAKVHSLVLNDPRPVVEHFHPDLPASGIYFHENNGRSINLLIERKNAFNPLKTAQSLSSLVDARLNNENGVTKPIDEKIKHTLSNLTASQIVQVESAMSFQHKMAEDIKPLVWYFNEKLAAKADSANPASLAAMSKIFQAESRARHLPVMDRMDDHAKVMTLRFTEQNKLFTQMFVMQVTPKVETVRQGSSQ